MKKIFFTGLFILFVLQGAFSQKMNKVVKDPMLHRDVLVGYCNRNGLEHGLFSQWFNSEYNNYRPDAKTVNEIAKKVNKTHITVVFGSWCGDSKMQTGRFYKILDEAGFQENNLKTIAVLRSIKAGDVDVSALNIQRVPTFIVYYQDKEIGRIVESPKVSLEADLEAILKKVK